jgi:hypothetical protein
MPMPNSVRSTSSMVMEVEKPVMNSITEQKATSTSAGRTA